MTTGGLKRSCCSFAFQFCYPLTICLSFMRSSYTKVLWQWVKSVHLPLVQVQVSSFVSQTLHTCKEGETQPPALNQFILWTSSKHQHKAQSAECITPGSHKRGWIQDIYCSYAVPHWGTFKYLMMALGLMNPPTEQLWTSGPAKTENETVCPVENFCFLLPAVSTVTVLSYSTAPVAWQPWWHMTFFQRNLRFQVFKSLGFKNCIFICWTEQKPSTHSETCNPLALCRCVVRCCIIFITGPQWILSDCKLHP